MDLSILKAMANETALRPSWIMGAVDISVLLNTFLGGTDLVALIAEDVQYVPIRAIYGLRRSDRWPKQENPLCAHRAPGWSVEAAMR